jgi:hypothetical protein
MCVYVNSRAMGSSSVLKSALATGGCKANLNLFIPTDVYWGSNGQSITITEQIIRTLTRVFTSERRVQEINVM